MGFYIYRAYIPSYAEISTPLTELTKKNKPNDVSWGKAEQNSFVKLKELLCEVTSLATPDANLPFQVHCDASDYGVGCCLTQQDTGGVNRPIAFASQKFNATQKNWASIEKEAWAVLYGLNKFDKWIYDAKMEIISDHYPLKYLNQTTPKSPKLTRWALALQRWNHSITHRPGQPLESFLTYCYQPMSLLLLQLPVEYQNSQDFFSPKSEDYYPQTVTSFAFITLPANKIT
ncbi:retrovirus-related Pol polyprotein from transposon opus [Trichonephila clavipes]|nr:retrovirus-related Pol polyprotein from transposon opus [Trichonephila clavipes]